jgi:hypothetical protein
MLSSGAANDSAYFLLEKVIMLAGRALGFDTDLIAAAPQPDGFAVGILIIAYTQEDQQENHQRPQHCRRIIEKVAERIF